MSKISVYKPLYKCVPVSRKVLKRQNWLIIFSFLVFLVNMGEVLISSCAGKGKMIV